MKFEKFQYLKDIQKGQVKMVDLGKISSEKELLSALSKYAKVLLSACFSSGGSLSRLTI
jgi:hypothetical protein